jgi:hypothetical protein
MLQKREKDKKKTLSHSGSFLIRSGVLISFVEVLSTFFLNNSCRLERVMNFTAPGINAKMKVYCIGLYLIGLGVFLETVCMLSQVQWKKFHDNIKKQAS